MDREVQMQTKVGLHLSAILSRAIYVDLNLHSRQALLARVESVCNSTGMLRDLGAQDEQIDAVIGWLKDNSANLRAISLRTAQQLAALILTDPDGWKDMAKVTLLRSIR
jgi:hypothetical protein